MHWFLSVLRCKYIIKPICSAHLIILRICIKKKLNLLRIIKKMHCNVPVKMTDSRNKYVLNQSCKCSVNAPTKYN